MTPAPFWLMIVSRATAVLPVWRSPMMSSRCPRPIGIIESIALIPVCSGSLTASSQPAPPAVPGELENVSRHRLLQAVAAADAVSDGQDDAGLGHVEAGFVALDLASEDLRDFFGADVHDVCLTPSRYFPGCAGSAFGRFRRR